MCNFCESEDTGFSTSVYLCTLCLTLKSIGKHLTEISLSSGVDTDSAPSQGFWEDQMEEWIWMLLFYKV